MNTVSRVYSVQYPLSLTIIDGSKTTVASDAEFQAPITASLRNQSDYCSSGTKCEQMEKF
jgi:hypothetical protein